MEKPGRLGVTPRLTDWVATMPTPVVNPTRGGPHSMTNSHELAEMVACARATEPLKPNKTSKITPRTEPFMALAPFSGLIESRLRNPGCVERSEEHTSELQSRPHL